MREIKFRVWDGDEMFYPEDFRFNQDWGYDINWSAWKDLDFRFKDGETKPIANEGSGKIMQYTGLKDKNGQEIYGGDIIKTITPPYTKAIQDEIKTMGLDTKRPREEYDGIVWRVIFSAGSFLLAENGVWQGVGAFASQELEVLGNIYENPELLHNE